MLSTTGRKTHPLSEVSERLVARYRGRHTPATVESVIAAAHRSLDGSRIQLFVPVLVEHIARRELDEMSR